MPLLPEHHAHGGSVSPQGAGARLSGPSRVYLGLRYRDCALPLLSRGGERRLFSTGGVLLLPGGAPHTRPPDPEVEETLKITHRGKPFNTNFWLLFLLSIKDTWSAPPPTSSTSHLEKVVLLFFFPSVIFQLSNQHSHDKANRGAGMCERTWLSSSAGKLTVPSFTTFYLLLVKMVWILLAWLFCFFIPRGTLTALNALLSTLNGLKPQMLNMKVFKSLEASPLHARWRVSRCPLPWSDSPAFLIEPFRETLHRFQMEFCFF